MSLGEPGNSIDGGTGVKGNQNPLDKTTRRWRGGHRGRNTCRPRWPLPSKLPRLVTAWVFAGLDIRALRQCRYQTESILSVPLIRALV